MLRSIQLENFKAFGQRTLIPFAPITLIFGQNSAGKSSILQSLSLLKQTRDSREAEAVLLPRTEHGFVDFGSFQELLFDHDLSKTLCIRLEMRLPKQRRHSGHLYQAFPEMKTLSLELQYIRKSPEEEVDLSRLQLYHGEGCLASFIPSTLKASNGRGSPSLATMSRGAFQGMLDPVQRLFQCDQVTASESFWQGCVGLVTTRRGQLVQALEEIHAALRHPATDFVEDEGGAERQQAAVRKLEDAIRFIGTASSADQLISWFRQEQMGRLVGLTNFLPVSVIQSQADPKIDDLLSRVASGVAAPPDWLPNVASLAAVAGIGAGFTLDTLFPLAPYRTAPFRLYYFTGTTPKNVGFKGQRLPALLFRNPDLLAQANGWLTKLDIGYEIVVRPLGPQLADMFEVRLRDKNRSTEVLVGLADVGFGISQLLPLVVQSLAGNHQVITIEQPELHIHPKLQADLGDLLIDSIQEPRRNQFIIETHSEHLALRLQRRVREKKLSPEDISVVYVSRGPNGASVLPLRLDDEGDFIDDFPGGFFPERLRELR